MRVRFLRLARADIAGHAAYIARDNPAAARRVVQAIKDRRHQLADWPESGSTGRMAGTRELPVLFFYSQGMLKKRKSYANLIVTIIPYLRKAQAMLKLTL
jgi:plasmid stabilization system protein ParE